MDKILIVEDDRFFREMFSNLLLAEGYAVDCATGGAEAMAQFAEKSYGLVITDLLMPDISGMEILSRVKDIDPSVDVIMVTGNANLESAIFALKHGARDYLVKPVNPDEFLHSVSQCMRQRRLLDENEELKSMLTLFQSAQTIAGCLELDRVYHLMVDAVAREIGLSRCIGMFQNAAGDLELQETKGMTTALAERYRDAILSSQVLPPPPNRLITRLKFPQEAPGSGIDEVYLVYVRSKVKFHGIIAAFNDPGSRLPDIHGKRKNIQFLVEQSSRSFVNAASYTQAKDMLFIDDLSGLFNHRYLEVALEREMKRAERYASHLAVLFLDMDSFKQVNDTFGHLVGSHVLKEMGGLLKKSVREVDVVIRYGGDEFTIILVETNCSTAAMVAERIRSMVESHIFLAHDGYNIRLSCSIGYACCPDDTLTKQELLEMADKAMYAGKSSGKNCVSRFQKSS